MYLVSTLETAGAAMNRIDTPQLTAEAPAKAPSQNHSRQKDADHADQPDEPRRAAAKFESLPDQAIVRLPVVLDLTGLSRPTIWRRSADGSFPKPLKLGATRAIGWRAGDVRRWLAALDKQVA